MERSQSIIVFVLILLIQVILNDSVTFGIYIYLAPICFTVLSRYVGTSSLNMLLTAFGTGVLVDLFSNGVPGLNAAALTAMAAVRKPLLKQLTVMQGGEGYRYPSVWNMGAGKYYLFSAVCCAVFFVFYVFLESVGVTGLWLDIQRIVAGTLINAAVMAVMSAAVHGRRVF